MSQFELIDVNLIDAGDNDRTKFNATELEALAKSIEQNGLLQPPTVMPLDNGRYEIVAGERRFRACKLLGWAFINVHVMRLTPEQASALMLAENTARVNLDPIEEARAFASRINNEGWSIEETAEKAGVTEVYVHFRLKLLNLRDDLQQLIRIDGLPLGYAQILADAKLDSNRQMIAFRDLRDNENPTPVWFRKVVAELATQQAQNALIDMDSLWQPQEVKPATPKNAEPPMPGKTTPPTISGDPETVMIANITFWEEAAELWAAKGKTFKKQECEAAVFALRAALAMMQENDG